MWKYANGISEEEEVTPPRSHHQQERVSVCISYSSAAVTKAAGGKLVHFGSQFQRDRVHHDGKDKPTGREGTVTGADTEARL